MTMFYPYKCCQCNKDIHKGYPEDDDEQQFCSKKCHDKYLKEHNRLPNGILKNYYGGM